MHCYVSFFPPIFCFLPLFFDFYGRAGRVRLDELEKNEAIDKKRIQETPFFFLHMVVFALLPFWKAGSHCSHHIIE